jgi:hypothetical protein
LLSDLHNPSGASLAGDCLTSMPAT